MIPRRKHQRWERTWLLTLPLDKLHDALTYAPVLLVTKTNTQCLCPLTLGTKVPPKPISPRETRTDACA